jgi:hypothetical protein
MSMTGLEARALDELVAVLEKWAAALPGTVTGEEFAKALPAARRCWEKALARQAVREAS